jgi:hypothetical protein
MPTARHGLAAADSIGDKVHVDGGGPRPKGSAVNIKKYSM